MPKMGRYCKAYPVENFRQFPGWSENLENLRKVKQEIDGKEVEVRRELGETDFFYLQEDFTVTDGIFLGENVIFNQVTPEWIEFCQQTLNFELPDYVTAEVGDAAK